MNKVNDFFYKEGLELARKITKQLGHLNCCKDVSEAVSNLANEKGIQCKAVECSIITPRDLGSYHYVIKYKDVLIDYTQDQFFGTNSPEHTIVDIIKNQSKNLYTNNTFYDKDKVEIKFNKNDEFQTELEFIKLISDEEITSDEDYILYFIQE